MHYTSKAQQLLVLNLRNAEFRTLERVFLQIHGAITIYTHLYSVSTDNALFFQNLRTDSPSPFKLKSLPLLRISKFLPPQPGFQVHYPHCTFLYSQNGQHSLVRQLARPFLESSLSPKVQHPVCSRQHVSPLTAT